MNQTDREEFEKLSDLIKNISVGQYDGNGVNIGYKPAKEVILSWIEQYGDKRVKETLEWCEREVVGENNKVKYGRAGALPREDQKKIDRIELFHLGEDAGENRLKEEQRQTIKNKIKSLEDSK